MFTIGEDKENFNYFCNMYFKPFHLMTSVSILAILALSQSNQATGSLEQFETVVISIKEQQYTLEIARTTAQRRQGLMYRNFLAKNSGMLFLYRKSSDHRIWMKNTRIPLTVVWFDATAAVIAVKRLEPCLQQNCQSYGARSNSKFIIEFNAGFSALKPGDSLPVLLTLKSTNEL